MLLAFYILARELKEFIASIPLIIERALSALFDQPANNHVLCWSLQLPQQQLVSSFNRKFFIAQALAIS